MHFEPSKCTQFSFNCSLKAEMDVPIELPINAKTSYKIIITKMHLFVKISSLENFIFADELFCITLVSCPVKTATPYINSVFFKLLPLNTMFSAPREALSARPSNSMFPSNL